jgi:hypothetical protein
VAARQEPPHTIRAYGEDVASDRKRAIVLVAIAALTARSNGDANLRQAAVDAALDLSRGPELSHPPQFAEDQLRELDEAIKIKGTFPRASRPSHSSGRTLCQGSAGRGKANGNTSPGTTMILSTRLRCRAPIK